MTPKEKAQELVDKFLEFTAIGNFPSINAKQCALIAVNEVIWAFKQMGKGSKFYDEVKQELEKL